MPFTWSELFWCKYMVIMLCNHIIGEPFQNHVELLSLFNVRSSTRIVCIVMHTIQKYMIVILDRHPIIVGTL